MSTSLNCRICARLLVGLFWLSVSSASAQPANPNWLVRSWQSDDGLPDSLVNALEQTADGYLWVGTPSGLARFDGIHFEVFPLTSVVMPPNHGIVTLLRGKNGGLWLGMDRGEIVFLDGRTSRAFTQGLPNQIPNCLTEDKEGGLWISYRSGAVYELKDGQVIKGSTLPGFPEGSDICSFATDRQGQLWFARNGKVGQFREGKFQTLLLEDKEGNIWVGTSGGGLDRISSRAITLQGSESGLSLPTIKSICEDAVGTFWATIDNGDLVHLVNNHWQTMPVSTDWPGQANCLTVDREGTIWIGSRSGLYCWRDGHFVNWNSPAAMRDKAFHAILVSRTGDVWLGQEFPSAILRLHAGQLKTFLLPTDSRVIRAMTEDAAGNIWAGTSKGTLFRVTGDIVTEETPRPTNNLAPIRCLHATTNGAVWIGYAAWGVGCLKAGQYTEFNRANGLYDNYISQIIADADGWLWFGANRGIFKVRQQDFSAVTAGRASRVYSIHYGRGEGLPSLQAPFGDSPNVLRSRDGRLWLPMQTALAVVDPAKLDKKLGSPSTLLTRVTVDDQMMAQYRGILPGSTPDEGVADLATAQVKLELPPGHRRLEIEFAALSFYAPGNIQFRYRLRGLDENWVEAGSRRSATYSRLPSGHYVFEAAAGNSAGDWNATSASFSLVVNPFYWQTWWFRLGLFLAFSAGIIATVRYVSFRRLQQQLRILQQQAAVQKERARIAKDIHDDLGANLAQIAYLGELAQMDRHEPDKSAERIGTISTTARKSIKSLDEIVWAVNPRNDTLSHLLDYVGQFALDYLRLAGIRVRLDFPEQVPLRELSTDLRHNVFLTAKEALHNIVKHAGATEVWLRAVVTEQSLEISVEDNGHGFDKVPDNALSDGLRNMRERMADIGGECRIVNPSAGGTKVVLNLLWPATKEN